MATPEGAATLVHICSPYNQLGVLSRRVRWSGGLLLGGGRFRRALAHRRSLGRRRWLVDASGVAGASAASGVADASAAGVVAPSTAGVSGTAANSVTTVP